MSRDHFLRLNPGQPAHLGLTALLASASILAGAEAKGFADDLKIEPKSGAYVAFDVGGSADMAGADELQDAGFTDAAVGGSVVVGGRGGYRWKYVAAEVDVDYLIESKVTYSSPPPVSVPLADISTLTVMAQGRVYLFVGHRLQPYALVGGGLMHTTVSESAALDGSFDSFAMKFGGGLEVQIAGRLFGDFGVGYLLPFDDNEKTDSLSFAFGLGYRF